MFSRKKSKEKKKEKKAASARAMEKAAPKAKPQSASRELSEEEIADLKEAFGMFDIDGDGAWNRLYLQTRVLIPQYTASTG